VTGLAAASEPAQGTRPVRRMGSDVSCRLVPVARLDPAYDGSQHWQRGRRVSRDVTTSEVSPPVLTRAQCPTSQPSRNGRRLTGRQPPTAPGARRQTTAHARETNTVTSVAPGAGLTPQQATGPQQPGCPQQPAPSRPWRSAGRARRRPGTGPTRHQRQEAGCSLPTAGTRQHPIGRRDKPGRGPGRQPQRQGPSRCGVCPVRRRGRHAQRVLEGVRAGVASGLTGRHRRHVGINLDVHDELLRGSAILRLPCEMPGRGIGMRPPGGPLLGGGTDERRVGTPAPPALAGQYLAGGCRETAVAAQ